VAGLDDIDHDPVIAPVLDLSLVEEEAQRLASIVSAPNIDTDYSYRQAATIASTRTAALEDSASEAGGVRFKQNIYAPEQLSTSDIYRQTRNQLRVAAEELDVP
jgi:hypothetical protein